MQIISANDLGLLVERERKLRGWSRRKLAEKAMVSPRWLVLFEKGQNSPSLDHVFRTLKSLNLAMDIRQLPENPLDEILNT